MGTEVRGKTLGIIGLGKIGSEVAKRARGMEMKVVAHDPFVTVEYATKLNVTLLPLEKLLKEADFITLHIPLTATTKGYIGARQLAMVKPTVQIINTARGGLIDEQVLVTAIKEGKVAGAAIDVFSTEPTTESVLFSDERIIVTPHLGASTDEAQAMAAIDIAEQVIDVFNHQPARYSVNAPFISPELLSVLAPYINMVTLVGRLVSQLVEGQMRDIRIKYDGEIATYDTSALKAAVLGGLLEEISEERVNLVNANLVATQRGLIVTEQKKTDCENYTSLVTVEVDTSGGMVAIAGTVLRSESHIVRFNDYWIDIIPTGGYFLFSDHRDRPGLIGSVGNITGNADINISYMYLSRLQPRGQALMILALDEHISEEQRQQILSLDDVYTARLVKL
jgi:D-3-phosphoglycerate dehydrogenase